MSLHKFSNFFGKSKKFKKNSRLSSLVSRLFIIFAPMDQVRAKKALGQHFLTDLNIAQKICNSLSGGTTENPDKVLEVGCGMGVLTQYLLRRDDIVTYGVDIDTESIAYLHAHYPDFSPRLSEGDFLKMDLSSSSAMAKRGIRLDIINTARKKATIFFILFLRYHF